MRKKKRKKRIGTKLAFWFAALLPLAAQAGDHKVKTESYALVAGTVFQESGYALPNALITLTPDPPADGSTAKMKKQQAISDARGEFVFRVPPVPMHFTVKAAAKGFRSQEQPALIEGETRVDVTFQLQPESK